MPRDSRQTRDRITKAAASLFYDQGIRSASVDAIAEHAGVTKRTLYYHFASKDELVEAYLDSRDQPTLELLARWFDETDGPLDAKIEGLFRKIAETTQHRKWKGCGFLRTVAELASTPGHPAVKAGAAHKKRFESWVAEQCAAAGLADAAMLARQIVVLLDGAYSVMLVHRDPAYVEAAGAVAADLVRRAG